MWHVSDPVFVIDIAIFGSSVGPYEVLSVIAASSICESSQAAGFPEFVAGFDDAFAEPEAAPEADDDGFVDFPADGPEPEPADADAVGAADEAPPRANPATMSTITSTTSTSAPSATARRRQ
jgi:hypothetical protein